MYETAFKFFILKYPCINNLDSIVYNGIKILICQAMNVLSSMIIRIIAICRVDAKDNIVYAITDLLLQRMCNTPSNNFEAYIPLKISLFHNLVFKSKWSTYRNTNSRNSIRDL